MVSEMKEPLWLVYERCAACFVADGVRSVEFTVEPNGQIVGRVSGIVRQIDVMVESRWQNDERTRLVFDAKRRNRPVDIGDVEEFLGLLDDVGASRGIIVCPSGWTEGAARRAQKSVVVELLTTEAVACAEFGFERCYLKCTGKRAGMILWWNILSPVQCRQM